jgi:septal ring-binding cell division protein DamX
VVYGEYVSRQAANQAKGSLPEALRKTSPIARSVGGILQEIRRLETES